MFLDSASADVVARALILSVISVFWVIFVVRVIGLRAFSKMTAFDFVITVAIGSLLAGASQATSWSEFFQPSLAMAFLLGTQYVVARFRQMSDIVEDVLQNDPVRLMRNGEMLEDALTATRVGADDVRAKLREANALDPSQVRAVVLETTGDISVLHGDNMSDDLLRGVRIIG